MDTIKIGLMAYKGCISTGILAALDFFRVANLLSGKRLFDVSVVGENKGPVICAHGQLIQSSSKVADYDPDVLIIPGLWTENNSELEKINLSPVLNRLRSSTVICSYCTGVIFHAQTGRLEKKKATATWWLAEELIEKFPQTNWEFNKTHISQSGNITASGANGYFPILEHLIRTYADRQTLREVQKYLLTPPLLAHNDPFHSVEKSSSNLEVKIKKLVAKTPARELTVERIALGLGLSGKTLSRKLSAHSKLSPAKYLRLIKFKEAAELMLRNNISISRVCEKLGFDDESNFRRGFKNCIQLTPGEYVRKFKRPQSHQ